MKRIFVSGGAGFIGLRLTKRLLEDEETQILVFDNLHRQVHGDKAVFEYEHPRLNFVLGDITDKETIQNCIENFRPDYCFHMASETGTGQSQDEVARYTMTNVQGTSYLIEALNNVDNFKKLILPSSRAVYGEGAYVDEELNLVQGYERRHDDMASGDFFVKDESGAKLTPVATPEHLPPAPSSIYASTKLMQEYLVKQGNGGKAWTTVILRLQNVYGPGQSLLNPYTGVLSIFASMIKQGKPLNIFEDGDIVRDFILVDDVVEALVAAKRTLLPHGEVINIGTGVSANILDVAKQLIAKMGGKLDSYYISGDFRKGDIRHAVADISKANKLLNWSPQVDLEDGLACLAEWVQQTN